MGICHNFSDLNIDPISEIRPLKYNMLIFRIKWNCIIRMYLSDA